MSTPEDVRTDQKDIAEMAAAPAQLLMTIQRALETKVTPEMGQLADRATTLLEHINNQTKQRNLVVVFEDTREIDPSSDRPESGVRTSYFDPEIGTLHYVPSHDDLGYMDTLSDQHLFLFITRKLDAAMATAWSNLPPQEQRQLVAVWQGKQLHPSVD